MVRTTLGAEVDTTVTVSGSEDVEFLSADSTVTVPAGGSEETIVRPPTGSIYVLLSLRLAVGSVSGSSTGEHGFIVNSESLRIGALAALSNNTDGAAYDLSHIQSATSNQQPIAPGDQTTAVRGLRAGPSNGFLIRYVNSTDASQADNREIRLWLRKIQVSE